MISKTFTAAAVALTASTLVAGQTFTKCNPLEKACPADPAIGKDGLDIDFTSGANSAISPLEGTTESYGDNGLVLSINKGTDAPTMSSKKYFMFGKVDIEMKSAPGNGVVTSAVLQSDDLDEVDWEFVGGDCAHVQSNYYSKGQTETYDRGKTHPVSNACTEFHTYTIEWTPTAINWMIDGSVVRTLEAANAHGVDGFPQTPMQVKLGTWDAGLPSTPEGTREWAGGLTDFSKAPFNAYYKNVKVVDYAGGDSPTSKSVKEYTYGDHSGTWQSIKAVTGSGSDSSDDDTSSSSSSATATITKTATKTHEATSTKEHTTAEAETTSAPAETTTATSTSTEVPTTLEASTTATTPAAATTTTGAAQSSAPPSSGAGSTAVTYGTGALGFIMMLAHLL